MEQKNGINFFFAIIALILGWKLFKDVDFDTFRLKEPALDALYLLVFIVSIYLIIKNYKKRSEK